MEQFRRLISYMDLYEMENKAYNIGYMKIDVRDLVCKIQLHISGLKEKDRNIYDIYCIRKNSRKRGYVGKIQIQDGKGEFRLQCMDTQFDDQGTKIAETEAFCIVISEIKTGVAMLIKQDPDFLPLQEEKQEKTIRTNKENIKIVENKIQKQKTDKIEKENMVQSENNENIVNRDNADNADNADNTDNTDNTGNEMTIAETNFTIEELRKVCPVIAPFEQPNNVIYYKLEPQHLSVLKSESQFMSHNSFLLHSYYNYRYIILGEREKEFYLGVPGIYHEREQMMASMFGFTGFKNSRKGNAKQGDFGYYMKAVDIIEKKE